MSAPLIELSAVTKKYGAVTALDSVSLTVNRGEIVGIIGQNGAGKSTLLKLLSGSIQADSGEFRISGEPARLGSTADAARRGIAIVHQEQSLIPNLTVAENVFVGRSPGATRGGFYNWPALFRDGDRQLAKMGCDFPSSAMVGELTFIQRQMVELTRALSLGDDSDDHLTILLDEPTSLLNPGDIEFLFAELRALKQRASVLFVSHRMDEVLSISDRVYVMSNGKCVAERDPAQCNEDELYRLMVGEERSDDYYSSRRTSPTVLSATLGPPALSVSGLALNGEFKDISFEIAPGSILGLGGVVDSGREQLARSLFGLTKAPAGEVRVDGIPVRISGPRHAIRHGIGYVAAERKVEGVLLGQSVARNLTYCIPDRISSMGWIRRRRELEIVNEWISKLKIKAPHARADVGSLSGGNQQKVALAKILSIPQLKVLIVDHPTRGLDLGAKADVYEQIRIATASGMAVLLLSDTLDELFGLSDNVIIMKDGQITGRHLDVQSSQPQFDQVVREMV